MNTFTRYISLVTLFICGAVLLVIGVSITLSPIQFYNSSGIELPNNIDLLNELRAPAAMLIGAGCLILLSLSAKSLRPQAWLVSTLVYLSYGIGRVIGFGLDGIPNESILLAAVIELFLGIISFYMMIQITGQQDTNKPKATQILYTLTK